MTDSSLPPWRRRLGDQDPRGAVGSRELVGEIRWPREVDPGAAALDGGGRRGGGLGLPRCDGSMRQVRGLARVWVATWMKTARAEVSSTRLDCLRAMRGMIWLLGRGGGPGVGGIWWQPR